MDKKHQPARSLPRRHLLATAIGSALVSGAGLAAAAEAPRQLGTVVVEETAVPVVSSPKQTAPLLDNPQTISVIPQAVYQAQGAQNLFDVLKNTPGISFDGGENGFAGNSNNFSLRGFDASSNIFIDGARDSGSYSRDIFNVEQVEVAKGAAADNGRGGAGGYVNLVTKSPRLENFIAGSVSYGFDEYDSKDRRRVSADINQKLADSTAVRLNLLASDGGKAGRSEVEQNTLGFAPSIAFGLGTDTRTVLSYQHIEQNDIPDFGVPGATIKDTLRYDAALRHADRDNFYGSDTDYDDTTSDAVLLRFEHDLSSGTTLSNQTRYAKTVREAQFTVIRDNAGAAPATVRRTLVGYARENASVSNQTNLSTSFNVGSFKHTVAAGVELSHETSSASRFNGPNLDAGSNVSVSNPDPNAPLLSGGVAQGRLASTGNTRVRVDTLAAYAYDTVALSERWSVTGGLRAEHYKVDIKATDPAGTRLDGSETTLGGKLGLVYKPARNGSIYASFSSSSEPPGSYLSTSDISRTGGNGLPGLQDGVNDPDNKPRVSLNYELGTKWSLFQERLLATAALFRTEKRNAAFTGRDDPAAPAATKAFKGYGEQVIQGVELGVTGKLTDAWSVFGGVVVMESERKHKAALDLARCYDNPADYGTTAGNALADCPGLGTDGDELAFTPKVTANLWTTYNATQDLTLGLGAQYVGSQIVGRPSDADRIIINDLSGELPSYTVVNAMASYAVNKNLTVRLNVDNVLDRKYASAVNWSVQRADLGTSRAFLVSADFKF